MSLAWHIVWKDLRRMAGPAALWLVFVLVASVWFRLQSFASPGDAVTGPSPVLVSTCGLVVIVQMLGLYVLAGALLMEDPMVSSTAFWLSRPIGRQRLLLAKLLAGIVLFVVVPVLCLAGGWFACGAGVQDVALAAGQCAALHSAVVVGAIAIASLSPSLLQFLPWTLGLVVIWWSLGAWAESLSQRPLHPNAIVWQALPACVLALLVVRFAIRRRRWAVLAFLAVLAVAVQVRVARPYVAEARTRWNHFSEPISPNGITRTEAKPVPYVTAIGTSAPDAKGSYRIPATARTADLAFSLDRAALARSMVANVGSPAIEWKLIAWDRPGRSRPERGVPILSGTSTSVSVTGATRLQVGNTIRTSASRVTVRDIARVGNGDYMLILEQHDVHAEPLLGLGRLVTDEFALVDREHGRVRVLGALDVDQGWLDWQQVRVLRVNIPAGALPERVSDASLVQVRFRSSEPLPFVNLPGGAE